MTARNGEGLEWDVRSLKSKMKCMRLSERKRVNEYFGVT